MMATEYAWGLKRGSKAELLEWHALPDDMPDAEITVILWLRKAPSPAWWESGFWDGATWRFTETGYIRSALARRALV